MNNGNSALTLPGPLVVAAVGQDNAVISPTRNESASCGAQSTPNEYNLLPGNYTDLCYGFVLPSDSYVVTTVQVSATAPAGSGSVSLPVTSGVTSTTTTTTPPTTGPPATLPGTAVATKVPATCSAQALTEAIAQAGSLAAPGTAVVDAQFACSQGYAKATVLGAGLPSTDTGAAYYQDVSGLWTVLSAGENLSASALGIPDSIYNELNAKVP
jgi:hypothetical protein